MSLSLVGYPIGSRTVYGLRLLVFQPSVLSLMRLVAEDGYIVCRGIRLIHTSSHLLPSTRQSITTEQAFVTD